VSIKNAFINFIHSLQDDICDAFESVDGKAKFQEDAWQRIGGGGGKTRIIKDGNVFEKGGVNTSVVQGELPEAMAQQFKVKGTHFFACGVSLVIHAINPMVPTVHANYRYFEMYDAQGEKVDSWFGGGADLTPYYMWEEDGVHFHKTHKAACDPYDLNLYPKFKQQCDDYFKNTHRNNEARGIGGIFYDYVRPTVQMDSDTEGVSAEQIFDMSKSCGQALLKAYLPIVEKRKNEPFTEENQHWQGIRRGRYVEFNLIHDRGTLFGLRTNGRIESILMSLPAVARWDYDFHPKPHSREAELLEYLKPRDWCNLMMNPTIQTTNG
jgi:coproporphyrinogen III oxidase